MIKKSTLAKQFYQLNQALHYKIINSKHQKFQTLV